MLFSLGALMTSQLGGSPLLTGLVAYYKLDGDSTAAVGGQNGTDTNITYSTGLIGSAAVFNSGATSKINLGANAIFNLTSAMSISVWIKSTNTAATNMVVIGKSHTTSYYINVSPTGADVNWYTHNVHTNPGGGITNIADGNWHHIVATINASGNKVLYWDGSSIASDAAQALPTTDANNVYIGNSDSAPGNNFNTGDIDEFGLWSRALTSGEVTTLYNSGAGKQYPF